MYFATFLILTITVSLTSAQIDVDSCTNATGAINKCNSDNGFQTSYRDPVAYITLILGDINTYCGAKKDDIKKAAGCVVDVTRGCGSGDFPKLYPTASSVQSAVDKLCDNKDDIDLSCVDLNELGSCVQIALQAANLTKPATNVEYSVAKNFYCQNAIYFGTCANTNTKLKDCSKPNTKEVYEDVLKHIAPETCGAMATVATSVLVIISLFLSFANNFI